MSLRILVLLLLLGGVRSMPIEREETTTELGTTVASEIDTIAPDDALETTTITTPEDDHSLESPSQTIEIRLHPQLIHADQLKPTTTEAENTTWTTTPAPTSAEDAKLEDIKRETPRSEQHSLFGSLSDRFRLKDSIGAALRRAITSSPVVHKLQQLPARTRLGPRPSAAAAAKDATPRKISSFGLPSNLPSAPARNPHEKQTPAGTRVESDHEWLYGHRESKRPIDTFRIPSTERWFVFGARETTTRTTTEMDETTAQSTQAPAESTTSTLALSGVTPEINYATPETNHATPESVHAQPEIVHGKPEVNYATPETNYATPERNYATPEINYATPEMQYGRPEAEFVATFHGHSSKSTTQAASTTTTSTTTELPTTLPVSESTATGNSIQVVKTAIGPVISISLSQEAVDQIKELTNPPLDGQPPVSQGLESSPVDDDEDYGDGKGALVSNLDDESEIDPDAHKYLVEEKTPDGYIVGEFGVISRSSGSLRGVRYTAHGSINPQLIQDALRTFLSLK